MGRTWNMNRRSMPKIVCFLILALVMVSCTDTSLTPVFYALENEKALVDDRGFPDDAGALRIVQNGPGGNYFAAAGILYSRDTTISGKWASIAPPVSGALCTNVEIFNPGAGTQLLAAFMLPSGPTGLGLWKRNLPYNSADSWSQVSDGTLLTASSKINILKTVGADLFVSTEDASYYNLYYTGDLSAFSSTNLTGTAVPRDSGPITDIESDGSGIFWVTVLKTLYTGGLGSLTPYTGVLVPTAATAFGSLHYSTALTALYLAGDNGRVFRRIGSGDWEQSAVINDSSGNAVSFTVFQDIPLPSNFIYVGTELSGYYSISGGDIIGGTFTRSPSYTIGNLYDGAIISMLYDDSTSPKSLLLGTFNAGLWRGDWNGTTWDWKQE
jgi:hypothetical protein